MQDQKFILTYWNLRGTTQSIRNLLQYLQVPYEDLTVQLPTESMAQFLRVLQNPQMPQLKYGDFEVIEIVPILKYICRIVNREDLLGKNLRDEVMVETTIIHQFKARKQFLDVFKSCALVPQEQFQKQIFQRLKPMRSDYIPNLIKVLGQNQWYMGYLTIVDFILFELLFYFQGYCPQVISDPVFEAYLQRFEAIEQIKQYFSSGRCCHEIATLPAVRQKWRGTRKYK